MAEADLSKIVGLIMENPTLIEEIKSMVKSDNNKETGAEVLPIKEIEKEEKKDEEVKRNMPKAVEKAPRKELLSALKPYVSSERAQAIDTMLSIIDILDMIKR